MDPGWDIWVMAFFTPRKKNRVSVDDPTRMQRKTGEHDGTKKRDEKELLTLQGTVDERTTSVVE